MLAKLRICYAQPHVRKNPPQRLLLNTNERDIYREVWPLPVLGHSAVQQYQRRESLLLPVTSPANNITSSESMKTKPLNSYLHYTQLVFSLEILHPHIHTEQCTYSNRYKVAIISNVLSETQELVSIARILLL